MTQPLLEWCDYVRAQINDRDARHAYGVLAIARRHPMLFSKLTRRAA